MNQPSMPPPPPTVSPTSLTAAAAPRARPVRTTSFIDTVRSEWIKIASLRSTWIVPIAAAAVPVVVMALVAAFSDIDDVDIIGTFVALLFIPMVVVNAFCTTGVTSEYNHDTIRVTYAATPRRGRVVGAKYLVLVTYSVLTLLAIMGISIGIGTLIVTLRGGSDNPYRAPFSDVGWPLFVAACMCVFALAVGYLIRNSAAAVTLTAVYPFVSPILAAIVLATRFRDAAKWLPFFGAWDAALSGGDYESETNLGRPWAFIYLLAVVSALAVIAYLVERRRDA